MSERERERERKRKRERASLTKCCHCLSCVFSIEFYHAQWYIYTGLLVKLTLKSEMTLVMSHVSVSTPETRVAGGNMCNAHDGLCLLTSPDSFLHGINIPVLLNLVDRGRVSSLTAIFKIL